MNETIKTFLEILKAVLAGEQALLASMRQQVKRGVVMQTMRTSELQEKLSAAYEVPYRKARSPLYIELHKHLFPPPESDAYGDMNCFFEGVRSRAVPVEIQGSTIWTLWPPRNRAGRRGAPSWHPYSPRHRSWRVSIPI